MRLAGQIKAGFYPIPTRTMEFILRRLISLEPENITLLDPCAGNGEAVQQLAGALGVPPKGIYAIELDEARGEASRALLKGSTVLAPCGFEATQCSYHQFSLIYLNPPYDDQFGGGRREELEFLVLATNLLMIGGILVFVAPINQFVGNDKIAKKLDCNYKESMLYTFPENERYYGEAIFIGRRRTPIIFHDEAPRENTDRLFMWGYRRPIDATDDGLVWDVPAGRRPRMFDKVMYTPTELLTSVRKSDIQQLFLEPKELPLPRPAMQLGPGHRSLLVICGFMNGVIHRPGESPFVLRGTIDKEFYVKDHQSANDESETTKYAENTVNNVRCIGRDGRIKTFSNRIGKTK